MTKAAALKIWLQGKLVNLRLKGTFALSCSASLLAELYVCSLAMDPGEYTAMCL